MENIKKIKVTDIDLTVSKSTALIIEIDVFRFMKEKELTYIKIDIECNGEYECLNEYHLENQEDLTMSDLERFALNWIFKHVEIVKEEELTTGLI